MIQDINRLFPWGNFKKKIEEMLRSKKAFSGLTVASGERWIYVLSNGELKKVFRLNEEFKSSRRISIGTFSLI